MSSDEKRDAAFQFALKTATAAGEAVKLSARKSDTRLTQVSVTNLQQNSEITDNEQKIAVHKIH